MKNVQKKLAIFAMVLSLLGVQSSYAQKQVSSVDAGTTPVTHEEADAALTHFREKARSRIRDIRNRLDTFINEKIRSANLPENRKAQIRKDIQSIRGTLQDIWKSVSKSDLPRAQTIDENITKQVDRVDQVSSDLK